MVFEVEPLPEFVSRGGQKLAGALESFGIDVTGVNALDVGASTGGFTDCLLQRGAAAVTAVDVGYGQLAWKLRCDPRVRVLERTNIRSVDGELEGAPFDLAVIDVSFIGLAKVLAHVAECAAPGRPRSWHWSNRSSKPVRAAWENGAWSATPRCTPTSCAGVSREAEELGWAVRDMTWSPIKGPEGNIEFWMRLAREAPERVSRRGRRRARGPRDAGRPLETCGS